MMCTQSKRQFANGPSDRPISWKPNRSGIQRVVVELTTNTAQDQTANSVVGA